MTKTIKHITQASILMAALLTSQANAGLIDRGNGLIYDDVLDITWLQDTNLAGTTMNWDDSVAWAAGLNYQGFDDWRLPTVNVTYTNSSGALDCDLSTTGGTDCGFNVLTGNSELAYMFHTNLSNVAYYDTAGNSPQSGWDSLNTSFTDALSGFNVSFTNLTRDVYWSGTEYAPSTVNAWVFYTYDGFQNANFKNNSYYAWAVRDGDVAATQASAPGNMALLALGLLGLVMRRRQLR